jgi:hypothetical protein
MQVIGLLKNNSLHKIGRKNIFLHKMIGLWGPLIWAFIKWLAFGTLDLGPKFGTPIWDPDLGPRFGTPIWDPDSGPRFGTPIWDPDLGPRFGE